MENIYLKSRYGHEVFLKKISESRYELYGNFSLYQLVKDETGNIISVDPEGGPMIPVGDHMQEGLVISKIIEDGGIILIMKTHSCLTCARFTNYRSALLCGDINTRIPKEVDISKGCDRWIEKGDTNWYFMPSEEGFLKKELRIEEEEGIYNEFMNGNNPYDRMDEERLELAENIKWRRVLECAYLEKRD